MSDNKKMFPEIFCTIPESIPRDEKYKFYYPIVIKCLENMMEGKRAIEFFKKIKVKRIVLYAVNELSKYLCFDLKEENDDVLVLYICDQNAKKISETIYDKKVYDTFYLYEDYKRGNIEKIVICNLLYENEIVHELTNNGILLKDILLFSNVIYDL